MRSSQIVHSFYLFFRERVLCSSDWLQTHYIAKDNLEFLIFLSLPSESWDYRLMPPNPLYKVLGIKPGLHDRPVLYLHIHSPQAQERLLGSFIKCLSHSKTRCSFSSYREQRRQTFLPSLFSVWPERAPDRKMVVPDRGRLTVGDLGCEEGCELICSLARP